MNRSVAADPRRRAEALRLLDQGTGAAEVARRLDVPAGTVRSWAHRAGKAGPPSGADPLSWAERKQRTADRAYATAVAALVRTRKLLDSGKTREAKDAALTAAILLDKSGGLEEAAQRAEERQVALVEAQAERIVAAVRWLVEDVLGLSLDTIPRSVMRQAILGEDLTMPAEAEAARRSIREQIASELQGHAARLEEGDGQRALSAPDDDLDARDSPRAEEMMGARRVITTLPERRQARSQSRTNGSNDVRVVDGEVVDKTEGWGAAAAGRKVPDGRGRPRPEQNRAERAKADAERERQPQTSAPGDLYGDPSRWHYR